MSITVITGPAASGKTTLARKLSKDKKSFEWVWPLKSAFVKVPKDCEVIVFDGLTSKDFSAIKVLSAQRKLVVNIQANWGYEIEMPDLIIVFDRIEEHQIDYWKNKATILCLNPKSNPIAGTS